MLTFLLTIITANALRGPAQAAYASPPHAEWSKRFRLDGAGLTARIWTKRNAPTEIEVVGRRGGIESLGEDNLYYDGAVAPYLRVERGAALLAFAADPGAGSGQYASVWRIWHRGHRIKQLGAYRDADLRQWFHTGIIREMRPAKYATDDILRVYPKLFDDTTRAPKNFIVSYRFDRKAQRFRFVRVRSVPLEAKWPDGVRFPAR